MWSLSFQIITTQLLVLAAMILLWRLIIPQTLRIFMCQHRTFALAPLWSCVFITVISIGSLPQAIIIATTSCILGSLFLRVYSRLLNEKFPFSGENE